MKMSEGMKQALPRWATAILLSMVFSLGVFTFNKGDRMLEHLAARSAQHENRITVIEQTLINLPLTKLGTDLENVKRSITDIDKKLTVIEYEVKRKP